MFFGDVAGAQAAVLRTADLRREHPAPGRHRPQWRPAAIRKYRTCVPAADTARTQPRSTGRKGPPRNPLHVLQQTFSIPLHVNVISEFESMTVDDWTHISPKVLEKLINSTLPYLTVIIVQKIIENYDNLSQEQKQAINTLHISNPKYIETLYQLLPELLMKFENTSEINFFLKDLINDPNNWWIAGSMGQFTNNRMKDQFNNIHEIIIMLSNHDNKRIVGALLAEMAQAHFDKRIGLQKIYEPTLYGLSRDTQVVHYANAWIDYQLESFGWYDNEYWSKVKTHLHNLSKNDELIE